MWHMYSCSPSENKKTTTKKTTITKMPLILPVAVFFNICALSKKSHKSNMSLLQAKRLMYAAHIMLPSLCFLSLDKMNSIMHSHCIHASAHQPIVKYLGSQHKCHVWDSQQLRKHPWRKHKIKNAAPLQLHPHYHVLVLKLICFLLR